MCVLRVLWRLFTSAVGFRNCRKPTCLESTKMSRLKGEPKHNMRGEEQERPDVKRTQCNGKSRLNRFDSVLHRRSVPARCSVPAASVQTGCQRQSRWNRGFPACYVLDYRSSVPLTLLVCSLTRSFSALASTPPNPPEHHGAAWCGKSLFMFMIYFEKYHSAPYGTKCNTKLMLKDHFQILINYPKKTL